MADNQDSGQEKTLAPSQRRLDQARDDGQVARSRDLSGALATFACVCALLIAGVGAVREGMGWLAGSFRAAGQMAAASRDESLLFQTLTDLLWSGLLVAAPILLAGMVAGILGSLGLGGLVLSAKAVTPDFTRLSPLKGLGRIFSLAGLAELGKSILKVVVLGGVAGLLVWNAAEQWLALLLPAPQAALSTLGDMLIRHAMVLAAALFVIAAADVPLQWWRHNKQLRMTQQEAKQENKETEGDPHVRGRVRQLQRESERSRMMQAVPDADVVITNPSHYAIALKYDAGRMGAPRVVAKGMDEVAARIRELAGEHAVALVESPKLARALYRHASIDDEVPAALYRAVAQVLAYVYQLRDHVRGPLPVPPEVDVPAGWDPLESPAGGRP